MDVDGRSLNVVCKDGYRMPSGRKSELFQCNDDGSWDLIDVCQCKLLGNFQNRADQTIH
jgi:Sushi repeat (SCR repeat)